MQKVLLAFYSDFPIQHLLLLSPLDGEVAEELPEGEAVGDVGDDYAMDNCGGRGA